MNLQSLRLALSKPSTSIQLCLIGLIGGIIAAGVIVIFRLCLILLHKLILGSTGNYTALPNWQLFLLPIIGVCLIIIVAKLRGFKHYRLGIPFVIHRLKMHHGDIPFATTINQFFGGLFALASGFVVGKEGPTVHLAAAASQYIGKWFKLPYNSLRILAGCGIAAGIAAAFNTPFAAVLFVMEVVIRDYKIHVFVPVMLAAACGSVITRWFFGDYTELSFLSFEVMPFWQLPVLVLLGICLGILATIFNRQLMFLMRLARPLNMSTRLLIAGILTGGIAYFLPEALGTEFANVNEILNSSPTAQILLLFFIAKFFLAIVAIALGVPGGLIGAVMVIGIFAGVLFLQALQLISEDFNLTGNFAILGLAGLLAAVLHAPLAALSAAMELSSTQQVILPALITIVSAYVTSIQLCKNRSIFLLQLEYQELPYTTTVIRDVLQYTGVMALMRVDFMQVENGKDADMYALLQDKPELLLINRVEAEQDIQWQLVGLDVSLQKDVYPITVTDLHMLNQQNTLAEVYELLNKRRDGGVAIYEQDEQSRYLCGVITWNMLHTYLLRQQH